MKFLKFNLPIRCSMWNWYGWSADNYSERPQWWISDRHDSRGVLAFPASVHAVTMYLYSHHTYPCFPFGVFPRAPCSPLQPSGVSAWPGTPWGGWLPPNHAGQVSYSSQTTQCPLNKILLKILWITNPCILSKPETTTECSELKHETQSEVFIPFCSIPQSSSQTHLIF